MRPVWVVDALRTPIGRFGGGLRAVRPDDLAALVLSRLIARTDLDPADVDEVVLGCANQAGEDNRNVARMAALLAGMPDHVPAITVNRLCASGLDAVLAAGRRVALGEADIVIAGGVESMTRAPWVMPKPETDPPRGNFTTFDTALGWRFPNPRLEQRFPLDAMGVTAENLARDHAIARDDQDRFAARSQARAIAAWEAGAFADEVVTVEVPQRKGTLMVDRDEGPRSDTTIERLARLRPAFVADGTVTAGNSSTLNDGAAALLLASDQAVRRHGWTPLARYVGGASAGVDPTRMGIGPVPATERLFQRIGWAWRDVDRVELNEAFAAQSLAVLKHWDFDPEQVNVHGGAIALGHPLGMSGARIAGSLCHQLAREGLKRGVATLCVGVGQGVSAAFERP
ncbi:MAG: thiolase family protein [Deltaproteobacteria bacterium]|nr:thiolase family protein [Deltaproteobacteria bacterium]